MFRRESNTREQIDYLIPSLKYRGQKIGDALGDVRGSSNKVVARCEFIAPYGYGGPV